MSDYSEDFAGYTLTAARLSQDGGYQLHITITEKIEGEVGDGKTGEIDYHVAEVFIDDEGSADVFFPDDEPVHLWDASDLERLMAAIRHACFCVPHEMDSGPVSEKRNVN